jgi:hypothetical protein
MPKFSNLRKLEVKAETTAEFTFYQIEGEPILIVAPATEANKPYFNKLLKSSRKNQRRLQSGNFTSAVIAENRDNDRALYPQFIVRGWKKVVDDSGKQTPFSQENVKAFLGELPDWLFDDLRNFAGDPQSFTEESVAAEDVAGNSQ